MASKKQDPLDHLLDAIIGSAKSKPKSGRRIHWYTWPLISFAFYCVMAWYIGGRVALILGASFLITQYLVRGFIWRHKRIALLADNGLPNPGLWRLIVDRKEEIRITKNTRASFEVVCRSEKLQGKEDKKVPALQRMRTTASLDVEADLMTAGGNGITINDIQQHASRFAEVAGATDFVVRRTTGVGRARLTWYFTDPIERVLRLHEVPESPFGTIAYGIRQDGTAAWVYQHMSILIGGMTRRGKSVVGRALVADLLKKGVYVDLYIADTKDGIQMAEFSGHDEERRGTLRVMGYATDAKGTEEMLREMVAEKERRAKEMIARGQEQHIPTEDEPLMIAWLDETLPLFEMLKQGSKSPAGNIAFTGAALDCALWVNSQLGDKATLGDLRDLIPQAICFETKTWQQTDTILGPGSSALGAACHEIGNKPGIGWSGAEFDARPMKFRAANVTKEESIKLSEGLVPDGGAKLTEVNPQHAVYRFYNRERELLYIGETNDVKRRFEEHESDKPWWHEVDMRLTKVVWLDCRADAKAEEKRAVEAELPKYNDKMNQANPLRVVVRKPKRQPSLLDDDEPDEPDMVPPAGTWPLMDAAPPQEPHRRFHRNLAPKPHREPKVKTPAKTGPDYPSWLNGKNF